MQLSPERSARDLRETPEEHAMKLLDGRAIANGSPLFVRSIGADWLRIVTVYALEGNEP
jgi:hypothetical protein